MPTRIQYSSLVELIGPLGPVEMLLPGEHGPGLCPIGLTVGLLPVAAVPLPAVMDPMISLTPVEGLERDCAEVGEENITVHGGWTGPDVARTHAVVAMYGGNGCLADGKWCCVGLCSRLPSLGWWSPA